MELLEGIIAEDLFIYLSVHKTFILSDIHIGYEESLHRQGILVPKNSYNDLIIRLEKSLEHIKKIDIIDRIVLNGDIIHEFGQISRREKELTSRFIKFLSGYGEVVIIGGNHDKALKFFINSDMPIKEEFILGDILIMHGDKIPSKNSLKNIHTLIIGHEHPAIAMASGSRVEKYKCFLKGKYCQSDWRKNDQKNLIVMPSCNLFVEGTDVLREKLLSPLLKNIDIRRFNAYLVGDKIYDFGSIRGILKRQQS